MDTTIAGAITEIVAELESTAMIDSLTGLLNRRALDRDLVRALALAQRHRQSLSVVMVDVDGLKGTNDQHGHDVGDQCLREIAANLVSALRAGDNVYRIGGDEFVVVLPGLREADIGRVMQRAAAGSRNSVTWGSACVENENDGRSGEDVDDLARAAGLLRLADRRMLDHREVSGRADGTSSTTPREEAAATEAELAGWIRASTASTVAVEHATGLIAEHFGMSIRSARAMLESTARGRRASASAVASDLLQGHLGLDELVDLLPRSASVAVGRGALADQGEAPT